MPLGVVVGGVVRMKTKFINSYLKILTFENMRAGK